MLLKVVGAEGLVMWECGGDRIKGQGEGKGSGLDYGLRVSPFKELNFRF